MRLPYAMRTLTEEIGAIHEDAVLETRDPDGFGVWRTLVLDKATTEKVGPLLDDIVDARILSKDVDDDQYVLTFVPDQRADDATPFSLDVAYGVLTGAGEAEPEGVDEFAERVEKRRAELGRKTVAVLREEYDRDSTAKKKDIIEDVLRSEGL